MSSKRRVRGRSCTGKVRHASAAGQAAMAGVQQRKGYDGPMACYHCSFCSGWHIGHRRRKP